MSDAKRQEIKNRIEAAQARNDERATPDLGDQVLTKAAEVKDDFTAFAKKHPVATVAGGLAAGILISALFKGSPTRKIARAAGSKTADLASLGSEAAAAFAQEIFDTTADLRQAGADKLEDVGDALGDKTRGLKRTASYQIDNASDSARIAARDMGKTLARSFRRH